MTSTLSIDRTSLSLSALVIPSTGFELGEDFSPGGVQQQRALAESRFVDGAALTAVRRQMTQLAGTLRAVGTTPTGLQANEAVLLAALGQFSFMVTWSEVGATTATYTWTCQPADVETKAGFVDYLRGMFVQEFAVTIPRQPTPVAGSL